MSRKDQWQLVLELSGVLTKIHVITYVMTVKTRFGTKPHIPFGGFIHNLVTKTEVFNSIRRHSPSFNTLHQVFLLEKSRPSAARSTHLLQPNFNSGCSLMYTSNTARFLTAVQFNQESSSGSILTHRTLNVQFLGFFPFYSKIFLTEYSPKSTADRNSSSSFEISVGCLKIRNRLEETLFVKSRTFTISGRLITTISFGPR